MEMIEFLIELGKRYGEVFTLGYITDDFLLFSIGWGLWILIVSFAVWLILRDRKVGN